MKMEGNGAVTVNAEPCPLEMDLTTTALLVIDMQRDFLEPEGFGASLGNDVTLLRSAVGPIAAMLKAARSKGITVIHTREGHRSDLWDVPLRKLLHSKDPSKRIGNLGPMGRILIRGEPGHEIIPELMPLPGEPVIDKPGKGAFFSTDLDLILKNGGIRSLIVCGVTTEVCVHTTVREANDRGYQCVVVSDGCASYFPHFHGVALEMISAQGGIFGSVSQSSHILTALNDDANSKILSGSSALISPAMS